MWLSVSLTCLLSSAAGPTADEVIARVLSERAKVRSWHLTGTVRNVYPKKSDRGTDISFEMWKQGDLARVDERLGVAANNPGRQHYERYVVCDGCWPAAGRRVVWTYPLTAVTHHPVTGPRPNGCDIIGIDLRKHGLLMGKFFGHWTTPIDEDLRAVPLADVTPSGVAGSVRTLAGRHEKANWTMQVDVDAGRGYSITRMIAERTEAGPDRVPFRNLLQCVPDRDSVSGLWYIRETTYEEFLEGELTLSHRATLRPTSVNQPIDPSVFTLAGLGILIGEHVRGVEDSSHRYWDGTRIVDAPPAGPTADVVPPSGPPPQAVGATAGWPRWLMPLTTAVFAVAAVALLRQAVRRRAG